MVIEALPIGAVLTIVTTQVLQTAIAAQDVLIEKESFKKLSKCLQDLEPVLQELRGRDIKDSTAVRESLESLQTELNKAKTLVEDCTSKSRFYLLINCRKIVSDAQQLTRDIGKSLELLSLATTEISMDIRHNVNHLKDQMMGIEYQASQFRLQIVDKLEQGVKQHRTDQGFANDIIVEIARAVGVPVEPSEINRELASFKREIEHLAENKQREEENFMVQIISLLSQADSAYTSELLRQKYKEKIKKLTMVDENPLQSFRCPLTNKVMKDPVTLSNGSTYEREEIEKWFRDGNHTDPITKIELAEFMLKPNIPIKKAIQEWTERNYCSRVLRCKKRIQSNEEQDVRLALEDAILLCQQSPVNREWIAAEDLIVDMVEVLNSRSKPLKVLCLQALHHVLKDNVLNKDQFAKVGGVEQVIRYLSSRVDVAKAAATLLKELMQGDSANLIYDKICEHKSAILLLVTLLTFEDAEVVEIANSILENLCDKDRNIILMAEANWVTPLIRRLCEGPQDAKLAMARALGGMNLTDQSKQALGETIHSLVEMAVFGNLESKAASLEALRNLSSLPQNKKHVSGGFPAFMDLLDPLKTHIPPNVRECAAEIIKNLTIDDGDDVLMLLLDASGEQMDIQKITASLLLVQENTTFSSQIRKHILQALVGMSTHPEVKSQISSQNGVDLLIPLLENQEREVRNCAVQLLYQLSVEAGAEVLDSMMNKKSTLECLVRFLSEPHAADVQAAAAGLIGNLPLHRSSKTSLVSTGVVKAIIDLALSGNPNPKVVENTISALICFTRPDLELCQLLADQGILEFLVTTLSSGSLPAKMRSASALKNLSDQSANLSIMPPVKPGCLCFRPSIPKTCRVHCGKCTIKTTFCIVEGGAVPGLIALLDENDGEAAEAAIGALKTLVEQLDIRDKGSKFLEEMKVIDPLINLLVGPHATTTKEKALELLEVLFKLPEIKEKYGPKARISLVDQATHGSHAAKKIAGKMLAQLEVIQDISSYF